MLLAMSITVAVGILAAILLLLLSWMAYRYCSVGVALVMLLAVLEPIWGRLPPIRLGLHIYPTDIDSMRVAIERIVFSPTRLKALKELGPSRAAKFSWAKCANETLDVYRSVL